MEDQTKPETYRTADREGFDVDREREEILFGETVNWDRDENPDVTGGIIRMDASASAAYDGIPLPTLKKLVAENYVSPSQDHNSSPTVGEFINHGETLVDKYGLHPRSVRYIAYVVSPYRDDARIDVPGMYVESIPDDVRVTTVRGYFGRHFGPKNPDHYRSEHADERDLRGVASAWWD